MILNIIRLFFLYFMFDSWEPWADISVGLSIVNPACHSCVAMAGSQASAPCVELGLFFPHAYLTFISIEFHLPSHLS